MIQERNIKVFSPATVSNVGCGYDIMGFSFDGPGDIIDLVLNRSGMIEIENHSKLTLPTGENNVIFPALKALLGSTPEYSGAIVKILEKIRPGSGIGSSAASSAGAVFAANELLEKKFSKIELIDFAMEGERLVSGQAHADNVAPCIMGGFTLVRSYNPSDIISIPYPDDLFCSVIHPEIEIKTSESRRLIRNEISVEDAVTQTGNAASLVAGLALNDKNLIGRSVVDVIAEPVRKKLIPEYNRIKELSYSLGAIAFNISGSGPSVFAFSDNINTANMINTSLSEHFASAGINSNSYCSAISGLGVRVIK